MEVKEESEKAGLKLKIKKIKIMASVPITLWQIYGGNNENSDRLSFLGLQSHWEWVIAVMKLVDACLLEEKLGKT